jgi:hypothetical protein
LTIDGKTVFLRPLAGKLLIVARLLGYKKEHKPATILWKN